MRLTGKIVTWNNDKGFGFVKPESGSKNIFIHVNEFNWKPQVGQKIIFTMGKDKRGRTCGKTATLKGEIVASERPQISGLLLMLFAWVALAVMLVIGVTFFENWLFAAGLVVISLLTYAFYWFDKNAAQGNARRIPESTLHLLSLMGGWPAALIAQQKLRHKTQKQPFKSILYITIIMNIAGIYFLSSLLGML